MMQVYAGLNKTIFRKSLPFKLSFALFPKGWSVIANFATSPGQELHPPAKT
jgi:hypothetical protein